MAFEWKAFPIQLQRGRSLTGIEAIVNGEEKMLTTKTPRHQSTMFKKCRSELKAAKPNELSEKGREGKEWVGFRFAQPNPLTIKTVSTCY